MMSKIWFVQWTREERYDLFFLILFAFSLPFHHSISNVVTAAYGVTIFISIYKRHTDQYKFNWEALRRTRWLTLLYLLLLLSGFYSVDKISWLNQIEKLAPLLVVPIFFCFVTFFEKEKM